MSFQAAGANIEEVPTKIEEGLKDQIHEITASGFDRDRYPPAKELDPAPNLAEDRISTLSHRRASVKMHAMIDAARRFALHRLVNMHHADTMCRMKSLMLVALFGT